MSRPHSPLTRFDCAEDDALPRVFHENVEEDKGKELVLGGFISPLLVDTEDAEVNPLHAIFDLKGVLVGKEYFKVNHFLPPLFKLAQGPTLLGKNIIPKLVLKEFLFRSLEQFIVYIWTSLP